MVSWVACSLKILRGLAIVPAVYMFNHWICPKVNWFSHLNLQATVLTISGQLSSFNVQVLEPAFILHPFYWKILLVPPLKHAESSAFSLLLSL